MSSYLSYAYTTVSDYYGKQTRWTGASDVIVTRRKDEDGNDHWRCTGFHIKLHDPSFAATSRVLSVEVNDHKVDPNLFCLYHWSDEFAYVIREWPPSTVPIPTPEPITAAPVSEDLEPDAAPIRAATIRTPTAETERWISEVIHADSGSSSDGHSLPLCVVSETDSEIDAFAAIPTDIGAITPMPPPESQSVTASLREEPSRRRKRDLMKGLLGMSSTTVSSSKDTSAVITDAKSHVEIVDAKVDAVTDGSVDDTTTDSTAIVEDTETATGKGKPPRRRKRDLMKGMLGKSSTTVSSKDTSAVITDAKSQVEIVDSDTVVESDTAIGKEKPSRRRKRDLMKGLLGKSSTAVSSSKDASAMSTEPMPEDGVDVDAKVDGVADSVEEDAEISADVVESDTAQAQVLLDGECVILSPHHMDDWWQYKDTSSPSPTPSPEPFVADGVAKVEAVKTAAAAAEEKDLEHVDNDDSSVTVAKITRRRSKRDALWGMWRRSRAKLKTMAGSTLELQKWKLRIPSSQQLSCLNLRLGANRCVFRLLDAERGAESTLSVECNIYLLDEHMAAKVVVTDVDGTISKSDVRGHLLSHLGYDWTHQGTVAFFNLLKESGFTVMYLTARSAGMAGRTKDWLFEQVSEGSGSVPQLMPEGPLLLAPTSTTEAFKREVIDRLPHEVKIPMLRHAAYVLGHDFKAGFGNRMTDALAYRTVVNEDAHIYIVAPSLAQRVQAVADKDLDKAVDGSGVTAKQCKCFSLVKDYNQLMKDETRMRELLS